MGDHRGRSGAVNLGTCVLESVTYRPRIVLARRLNESANQLGPTNKTLDMNERVVKKYSNVKRLLYSDEQRQ